MRKKIIGLIIFIAAVILLWHFALPIEKFSQDLPNLVKQAATSPVAVQLQNIEQNVFTPPPLKSTAPKTQTPVLSNNGVIVWTNIQRKNNGGLSALSENAKLDQAAQIKLKDMFAKQYFEHVSPSGVGPSGLVTAVGYAYISIGENLAEGYFKNDQALVQAWMNSPGHRANILNNKFTEIGVAVGKGQYQGQQTWMAVQEFGRPSSSCPSVDAGLKDQISSLQADINQLQPQLTAQKSQLDSANPQTPADYEAYNQQVATYNSLVKIYNNKVDSLKLVTGQYNTEVSAYNSCLAG